VFIIPDENNLPMYNHQLLIALEGIKKAVQGEREDELFYDYLISTAPNTEQKDIIVSIRDDERTHNHHFRNVYRDFTGMEVHTGAEEKFEKPKSYLEGIQKALLGELGAIRRYRVIRENLPMLSPYRDILFDIITDEIRHSSLYNYLLYINSVMSRETSQNTEYYTPDDWVTYITPLVNEALKEEKEGINSEHLYQEYILSGILVGFGYTPQDAINKVEEWEKTGQSKLLAKSKMGRSRY